MAFKEYKVLRVNEGACGSLLLGASTIPIQKFESELNKQAAEGWQVIFEIIEKKRFLLFFQRESLIITLGR